MAIDQILRRHFWIVVLPVVGAVAALNAQAVAELVGISIGPSDKELSAAHPGLRTVASADTTARTRSADPILARNPFDHVTGSLTPRPEDVATETEVDTSDPFGAPACDGVKVLVIVASSDPDWSMAAFGESGKSVLRRRGGEVSGKRVKFVGWDRVWMENGSQLCQAKLFGVDAVTPAPAPAPVASTPAAGGRGAPAVSEEYKRGIKKLSATEYEIDRGIVDKILENQAELMKQARIVPEQKDGKTIGVRLYGVRADTLLGTLGMENSDVLKTINGFEMASPEKALEAYARLRTADKLVIQIDRKGAPMNLDYKIK